MLNVLFDVVNLVDLFVLGCKFFILDYYVCYVDGVGGFFFVGGYFFGGLIEGVILYYGLKIFVKGL